METIGTKKTLDDVVAQIQALDLAPIKFKLMDAEEGHGWSREYADRIEIEYKRFLTLVVKYPEASVAPSKAVDKFWHGHILDTLKYAEDCQNVFGYFLHHFPYFGMRGSEDAANLAAAADTLNRLYREEFGEPESIEASSYCGLATDKNVQLAPSQSGYCGIAAGAPSYCGIVAGKTNQAGFEKPSYCGATVAASYCGIVAGKPAQAVAGQSSYCGIVAGASSYCGIANLDRVRNDASGAADASRESVLNTSLRPSLPPADAK